MLQKMAKAIPKKEEFTIHQVVPKFQIKNPKKLRENKRNFFRFEESLVIWSSTKNMGIILKNMSKENPLTGQDNVQLSEAEY